MIIVRPVSKHTNSCSNFGRRAATCAETYDPGHRGHANTEQTGLEQIMACNLNVAFHEPEVGRDSSVGIATRYGLDGRGIESRWERGFPHPFRPGMRPTRPPKQ